MLQLRHPSPSRAWTLALLWCALTLRVAVPSGYMLDAGAGGWPRLIVCPAATPMRMTMLPTSAAAHQHHRHDPNAADHPCAFASASAAVDVAAVTVAAAAPVAKAATVVLGPYRATRPGLGLAAPPPPKTGPPLLA